MLEFQLRKYVPIWINAPNGINNITSALLQG